MKVIVRTEGSWVKATNAWEKLFAKANTLGMRDIGKEATKAGRDVITAAGFSTKFAETLVYKSIPKTGYVLDPAIYIHSTVNYADIFEKGATIAGNPLIWLPLPNVPPGHNGRPHLSPKQYVAEVGPLVTMRRPGKPPMLGARVPTGRAARPTTAHGHLLRKLRQRTIGAAQQYQTIPLYVGVSSVSIPSKFNVHSAFETIASKENIQEAIEKREDRYVDPNGPP